MQITDTAPVEDESSLAYDPGPDIQVEEAQYKLMKGVLSFILFQARNPQPSGNLTHIEVYLSKDADEFYTALVKELQHRWQPDVAREIETRLQANAAIQDLLRVHCPYLSLDIGFKPVEVFNEVPAYRKYVTVGRTVLFIEE